MTGSFWLELPCGRRIRDGRLAEPVGRCRLQGRVGDLLTAVAAIGGEGQLAGAGWCAKGGQRLAVWASSPPLLLESAEVMA